MTADAAMRGSCAAMSSNGTPPGGGGTSEIGCSHGVASKLSVPLLAQLSRASPSAASMRADPAKAGSDSSAFRPSVSSGASSSEVSLLRDRTSGRQSATGWRRS